MSGYVISLLFGLFLTAASLINIKLINVHAAPSRLLLCIYETLGERALRVAVFITGLFISLISVMLMLL